MEDHNLLDILLKMRNAVGWRWPSSYVFLELSSCTHAVYGVRPSGKEVHLFSIELPRHRYPVRLEIKKIGITKVTKEQFEAAVAAL